MLYKNAYFGLITHFLKYMYKVFSYAISFLVFASGALVVVFMHFCVALFAYKEALSQNTSICTRILSYIIVNWSSFGKCKNFETCFEKSMNPINAQDLYSHTFKMN